MGNDSLTLEQTRFIELLRAVARDSLARPMSHEDEQQMELDRMLFGVSFAKLVDDRWRRVDPLTVQWYPGESGGYGMSDGVRVERCA
jgi:hypothetical protein